ncbi:MAG: 4Fe-4S binding protein, partial [Clostridiales bacterium]
PQEYLDHINDKICSALKCRRLLTYEIDGLKCVGCAICGEHCSSRAISGRYKKLHYIDEAKCDHCGECLDYCHFNAINIKSIKKDI